MATQHAEDRAQEPDGWRPPTALAIAAHSDDIEFMMGGTLALLAERGWDTHYMTLADGYVGSSVHGTQDITQHRALEAQRGAAVLGASWHPCLVGDCEIVYSVDLLRRVTAVVREVRPSVVLTQAPDDYMEDHIWTSHLVASACFNRNMPNFAALPPREAYPDDVTVYHAQPHGLHDLLRRRIFPGIYVDTSTVQERKREALGCHETQNHWLNTTQGFGSLIDEMDEMSRTVGEMSRRYGLAEGWRRHSPLGFSAAPTDPLTAALSDVAFVDDDYETALVQPPFHRS